LNGWIKLHRRILDHHLWPRKRAYTRLEAWLDLIMSANHRPVKRRHNLKIHIITRGQVPTSIGSIAKRWKWSHGKVRRFLEMLKNDSMIDLKTEGGFSLVSICNYETYQVGGISDGEQTESERRASGERVGDTLRMYKNVNKEKKKENARDYEFQKHLFDKLRNRFGLMEDHYPAYRHHIEAMLVRWTDKTETLVDAFLSDKESGIRDLRYLCEQGIDKYAAPKRKKAAFRKTPNGEYVAYCSKCSNQLFYPTLKSLQTSSDCHAADLIPERPHAKKAITQNISAQS